MRRLIRASVSAARAGALGGRASRGVERVTQVHDAAVEVLRSRRDPTLVATRRRLAAQRRLVAWLVLAAVLAIIGTVAVVSLTDGTVTISTVGGTGIVTVLFVLAAMSAVRSGIDLRARTLALRRMPPAQPRRHVVGGAMRPVLRRLDGYSDALRLAVGRIGGSDGAALPSSLRALRDDTLAAADAAEVRLRDKADELVALLHAGGRQVDTTRATLDREIRAGVDEYGRLVAAACDAAAASNDLARSSVASPSLAEMTGRLTTLAAGMRDLTGSPAENGTA